MIKKHRLRKCLDRVIRPCHPGVVFPSDADADTSSTQGLKRRFVGHIIAKIDKQDGRVVHIQPLQHPFNGAALVRVHRWQDIENNFAGDQTQILAAGNFEAVAGGIYQIVQIDEGFLRWDGRGRLRQ